MTTKRPYTYTVLRYVHDVSVEEFINVGVVLRETETGNVHAGFQKTIRRVRAAFPDVDRKAFVFGVEAVECGLKLVKEKHAATGGEGTSAGTFARRVLQADDSSFQWSPEGSGLSANMTTALDHLFERLVALKPRPEHIAARMKMISDRSEGGRE